MQVIRKYAPYPYYMTDALTPPEGLTPRQLKAWRWNHSEKGRAARKRYAQTAKGIATTARHWVRKAEEAAR